MSSEATPGPWHVVGELGEWVNDERNMNICRVNPSVSLRSSGTTASDGSHAHSGNARLIAAAPDLLEAAKIEVAAQEKLGSSPNLVRLQMFKDAIAKAEGREAS